ncbi:MAG TPA: hypothetical protein VJR58_24445 [Vineibacter sp.]|nr:hypothetical protein [Vineibacter sp.]
MTVDSVKFDPKLWRPYYLFLSQVSAFMADIGADCKGVDPGPPPDGYPQNEIDDVVRKRGEVDRDPDRKKRIISQDRAFPDFLEAFGLTYPVAETRFPWVHAATYSLPIELSRPVLLNLKRRYDAARPWQLAADLRLVVPNPGHPAYPSGHTCQCWLAVEMIKCVMPDNLLTEKAVKFIEDLAADTAVNREYAGLHYMSDTAAGRRLTQNMMPYIKKHFADLIAGAQKEARTAVL